MALSPESRALYEDPIIQSLIAVTRNAAQLEYSTTKMPWGEPGAIRKEGRYPLHTVEGQFDATLLRILPDGQEFLGAEFRIVANRYENTPAPNPLIIQDAIPIFLKELSDQAVQERLADARREVAARNGPAFLVQTRASDIHDGEYRDRPDGQLDLQEEMWYAKLLRIMEFFPGMRPQQAGQVLEHMGIHHPMADYGLGMASVLSYFYHGAVPSDIETEIIEPFGFIQPFPAPSVPQYSVNYILQENEAVLGDIIARANPMEVQRVDRDGQEYVFQTLAHYAVMQDGVKFDVQLIAEQQKGKPGFKTYRILRHGDKRDAYVRIDSICVNGVQAGDIHCDCRLQSEVEKNRAKAGIPMMLINIRDDEGRGHGEGPKGGTLFLQRLIRQTKGIALGNGVAAQLFYYDTGEEIDMREYSSTQALLKYLDIDYIAHFVTNNMRKIEIVRQVCEIGEVVSADAGCDSDEAKLLKNDKQNGQTGVAYKY